MAETTFQEELARILAKIPSEVTSDEAAFLRARVSYVSASDRKIFADHFKVEEVHESESASDELAEPDPEENSDPKEVFIEETPSESIEPDEVSPEDAEPEQVLPSAPKGKGKGKGKK